MLCIIFYYSYTVYYFSYPWVTLGDFLYIQYFCLPFKFFILMILIYYFQ